MSHRPFPSGARRIRSSRRAFPFFPVTAAIVGALGLAALGGLPSSQAPIVLVRSGHAPAPGQAAAQSASLREHAWILDPTPCIALTLVLQAGIYEVAGEFARGDMLTSGLFPGLEVSLPRLFR